MGKKRKSKDPYTGRRISVRADSFLSHSIKVGTEGVVWEWHNSEELGGDIVMLIRFDGRDDFWQREFHEVNFIDE